MPARCGPPSGFNAVSSEPQSLPFAHITCCMRESFESGREMTSSWAGAGGLKSKCQQPVPAMVTVVVLLMQKPCGVSIVASVPEPGCCCFGGMAYWFTPSTLLFRLRAGDAEFNDEVFVRLQTS